MLEKIKPLRNKVILRYSNELIENATKTKSGIYIAPQWREGEFALEVAEVLAASEDSGLSVGDTVVVDYMVQYDAKYNKKSYDGTNNWGQRFRNANFIERTDEGDEIRWAYIKQIYAIIKGNDFQPMDGWVFCDKPMNEDKIESVIITLDKKQETDKKPFKTRVFRISKNDSKKLNVKRMDIVYCDKNTDMVIKILDKEYIRVPADRILGYISSS
jgi:co-chaperonin GroES (HSP10)